MKNKHLSGKTLNTFILISENQHKSKNHFKMKILFIHANYVKINDKRKAIADADEIKEKNLESEECLVAFTAVEKDDEKNKIEILNKAIDNIKDVYSKVNAKSIAIYPYTHLSSNLSSPKFVREILQEIYENLKGQNLEVIKAPFGYFNGFEIKCKDDEALHPLSKLCESCKIKVEKENAEIKITQGMENVMKVLSYNEAVIVRTLLFRGCVLRRNEVARETGISRSSLSNTLRKLEENKVVEIDRTFRAHTIKLTEWFKSL